MPTWRAHLATWLVLALAHMLLPVGLIRLRGSKSTDDEQARLLFAIYSGLGAMWCLSGALVALIDPHPAVGETARIVFAGLTPVTAGLALVLEQAFAGENVNWMGGIAGVVWAGLVFIAGVYAWRSGNMPWIRVAVAALGWASLWALAAAIRARRYVRATLTLHRNRALYWTWASMLLMLGQGLALFSRWPAGAFGLLLHLGGLVAVLVAIIRQQLPNVRAALRQSFAIAVIALVATPLLAGSWLMLSYLPRTQSLVPTAVGLAAVVATIVAWIYGPLTGLAERLAERLVPRAGYNMDERLSEYSLAISDIIDLDQLATMIVGAVSEVLDVQRAALIAVIEENDEIYLRPLKGKGDMPLEEISFGTRNPIIEHMEAQQRSLFHHDIEHDTAFRGLLPQIQTWLEEMGMEVYVPIFAQSVLIGILAAGPSRSGEPFGHRDRTFLNTLAGQTSVALQNAKMFENMRELNLEITQLNEELRQAMERVERLNRAKGDFLTIASHELRTPLTHMKGYTHLLEELHSAHALTPEQTLEVSHSIGQAVDRLETIVSAIVDMSQLDRGELDTVFSSTTLKAVLRLALEQWMEPIKRRRLRLSVKGVEDIPPIVADVQRLSQAFGNLISNAIKYTPDGGVISIHAHQTDETHLEVIISDTGVGISPEDQAHIFDQFFRVGSADRHSSSEFEFKGGGPGLGLAIARGIIEAHGGSIWVKSQGHDEIRCPGSEFHVVLPLQAAPAITEPPASTSPFTVAPEDL
jgi:signal transduction histidine kinase